MRAVLLPRSLLQAESIRLRLAAVARVDPALDQLLKVVGAPPPLLHPSPHTSILVQFQGLTCDSYPNGSTTILTCLLASRIHLETEIVKQDTKPGGGHGRQREPRGHDDRLGLTLGSAILGFYSSGCRTYVHADRLSHCVTTLPTDSESLSAYV